MAVNCCVRPFVTTEFGGEIPIDTKVAGVTLKVALLLLTLPDTALIDVEPMLSAVLSPAELIVATAGTVELHVADEVRSWVDASVYVPVAVNCCVRPFATEGAFGFTAIETKIAAVTVSVALLLVTVPDTALTVVEPIASELANPVALIAAVAGTDELHVADEVRSCVEASV
jgi:hypothetical protein